MPGVAGNDEVLRRQWLGRQLLLLALSACLLLAVFETTRLDVELAHYFFDPAAGRFLLREHWFLDQVMHHGLKMASYALAFVALGLSCASLCGRLPGMPSRNALLGAGGLLLTLIGTPLLKHFTNRHCPWDVLDFGGYAPYLGLLAAQSPELARGACFPAGHASAGFAWVAWGVALRGTDLRYSRLTVAAAFVAGGAMGLGRMLQGAHFLSHTLWSAWFAWALTVSLVSILRPRLQPAPASPPCGGQRS